ncbi:MAG: radical SAM protein [Candidatus Latescibacterota bacterium]|jgi:MoaA/NifB/PqqE/SkfB family radical SAM enzyme|nr:MAG: radical SAM protein [Candidatus Latescibacterota bacterium]
MAPAVIGRERLMIPGRILESASFKDLYRFMLENRLSRKALFSLLGKRLRRELVAENAENRPKGVQELKHAYTMALLHGFDRAMTRGHVSRRVAERLLDTVLDRIIAKEEERGVSGNGHPLMLVVSPTNRCNLRCEGCYAAGEEASGADLRFETFDRIVAEKRALWDSHLTVVSGGEPLLWRDGGRGLFDLARRHPTEFFMVYTNGTLISEEVAEVMGELGNVSPAVSLEGFEKETDERRGTGAFVKALAAFERLRRRGVPFGVSVTPTSRNWDVLTSDRFIDFCFEEQGAVYGWSFQYMPIGRAPDLDLMVTPEQRFEMLERTNRLVREKKVFFADFWNSGAASYGCISAGRAGGHFYIDWNGDVMPCVFIPYAAGNIYSVYERGGNLDSLLETAFFRKLRAWQDEYGYARPPENVGNWLCPCPIRDNFDFLRRTAVETDARPVNAAAARALADPVHCARMSDFAGRYRRISAQLWDEEFAGRR